MPKGSQDWDLHQVLVPYPNPNTASFSKGSTDVGWTVPCGHTPKRKKNESK